MRSFEKILPIIAIFILLIYAISNYLSKAKEPKTASLQPKKSLSKKALFKDKELNYIIDVINHGSNKLNFPDSPMEGGFVPKEKAKDVACYLLELRGKPCKDGYKKDTPLYFSSNCAGCLGADAKGIKGSYPNLLRKPFLGLERD